MYSEHSSENAEPEMLQAELSAYRTREVMQAEAFEALRSRNAVLEAQFAAQRDEILRLERALATLEVAHPPKGDGVAHQESSRPLEEHLQALQQEVARLRHQLAIVGDRESRHQSWERRAWVLYLFSQRQALAHCAEQMVFLVEGLAEEIRVMMHSAQIRIGKQIDRLMPGGGQAQRAWQSYLVQRNRQYGTWKHSYRERMQYGTPDEIRAATLRAVLEAQPTHDMARIDSLGAQLRRETEDLAQDLKYLLEAYTSLSAWAQEVRSSRCFKLGEIVVCQLVKLRLRPRNAGFLQRIDSLDRVFAKWAEAYRKAGPPSVLPLPSLPPVRHR